MDQLHRRCEPVVEPQPQGRVHFASVERCVIKMSPSFTVWVALCSGNLTTKSLHDIVKEEDFIKTEKLTTLLVVVPKCSPALDGSALLILFPLCNSRTQFVHQ